jgi:hypothetical protein
MWRGGFDLELLVWLLNMAALAFGAFLGARALFDPHWGARLVRLKADDERLGGFAEFRATYGGLFAASHGLAFLLSAHWVLSGAFVTGAYAAGAALVLGAAWVGTGAGRALSMARDNTATSFNKLSLAVEVATGLLIASPWIFWTFLAPA